MKRDSENFSLTSSDALLVQRKLLKKAPSPRGLEIAVSWRPAGDLSGDFYDFVNLEEESLGVAIGDISGKGYTAALLMVYALAEVRARFKAHQRLAYMMSKLDESLQKYSDDNKFAEMLLGIYILPLRRFVYVQAGGIIPVVFRRLTDTVTLYPAPTSRLVGSPSSINQLNQRYAENAVDLECGDILILFTDGVRDRIGNDGETIVNKDTFSTWATPFMEGICRKFSPRSSAQEMLGELLVVLDSLDSTREDDETIVVLKAV